MNDELRQPVDRRYHGGLTVQLSVEASALLHRALEADEDARDVVSGCVESMLGSALDDSDLSYQEAIRGAKQRRLAREQEAQERLAAIRSYQETTHAAAGKEGH